MKKPETQPRQDAKTATHDPSTYTPRLPDAREVLRLCRAEVLGLGMAERLF